MIAKSEREQIIALIKQEVVPAIGCTEPIAVALCVAKATELLGQRPEKIKVLLSANILKNAMGVGSRNRNDWTSYCCSPWCTDRKIGISIGSSERQHSGSRSRRQKND